MVDCNYRAGGRACALAPSPTPQPPSAPTLRERKGEGAPSPTPQPPSAPTLRERKGGGCSLTYPPAPLPVPYGERKGEGGPHLPPGPLPLPLRGEEGGREIGNAAMLRLCLLTIPRSRTRSPRSRSAGAGPAYPCSLTTRQPCGTVQPLCTCVKVIYQGR